jgi:hypothetical protein
MLTVAPFDGSPEDWDRVLATFPDRQVFQTSSWLAFLADAQRGTPVQLVLRQDDEPVGYFAGLVVRKFGMKILGSPFAGWTTSYMGLRLRDGLSRSEGIKAVLDYAFHRLHCIHFEFRDRSFRSTDAQGLGLTVRENRTFEIDLAPTEDELFANMASACRRCIRKADRVGLQVEEADDLGFADEYYAQLQEVFAKQDLVPTYRVDRVRLLIKHMHPTGLLLLLRARDPAGRCVATGIFPAMNTHMYFWGGASWRADQHLRPNEAIMWYAMRYWKRQGIRYFDMVGGGNYKQKYGSHELRIPCFARSRMPLLQRVRDAGHRMPAAVRVCRAVDRSPIFLVYRTCFWGAQMTSTGNRMRR